MKASTNTAPGPSHWAWMMGIAAIWGASFMLMTVALRGFGPISISAYRVVLAAILLLALAYGTGKGLPSFRGPNAGLIWLSALGTGIVSNALPFFLLSWGQQYVASGFAGVTMATVPLMVLPLAHLLVPGERMTWAKSFGFALGFVGVILLIGAGGLRSLGGDGEALGRLACVSAALCYALGAIITRLCPAVSKISLAAATMLVAALIALPLALIIEGVPQSVPAVPALSILVLGVFATAGGQIALVKVVREAGPSFMSLVNYQVPLWSLFFGWSVLNESLPATFFVALGFIFAGMILSQWSVLRRLLRRV